MPKKTFLAGEAAVKLIPNAKDFHHKARQDLANEKLTTGVTLKPNIDKKFRSDAKSQLEKIKLSVKVDLRPDITGFRKEAQGKIDAGKRLDLKVDIVGRADRASIRVARQEMQAQIDAMRPLQFKVEADTASAHRELLRWRSLQQNTAMTVRVNADTTAARQDMARLRTEERAANDRRKLDARRNKRTGSGGGSDGGGASTYQKVRSAAMMSAITFAPIVSQASIGGLIAIAGAASMAGGTIGLLPAIAAGATAGFAALGVGLSGIMGAFQALGAASEDTGSSAGNSGAAAANAARQVTQAQRSLSRAQEAGMRAQDELNEARKQAVRRLRDMNDALDMAPINERDAALAIKESKRALADALKGGDSLEIEGARIDLDRSKEEYDQLKKQNQDLVVDTQAANKAGIEGDKEVIDAKRGVRDANDAIIDAQDQLTAALEAQTEAMTSNSAAADKAAAAMAKLSPNAREFVTAMRALGPEWTDLRKAVQDKLFEGMGQSVTDMANNQLPVLKEGLSGIAGILNGGVRQALAVFSTDSAIADFTTTLDNSKGLWSGIADSFAPLSQAFIDLSTVGSSFLPRMGDAIRTMSTDFGDWIAKMRESGQMQAFFEKALEVAKQLGRVLSNVGHIIGDLFSAGADTGGGFLNTIETVTKELRNFTESVEGQESMKMFFQGVGEAVRALAPILTIVAKTIFDTLGPALTDLVIGMGPGLVALFEGLRMGLQAIAPMMPALGEAIGTIGMALGEVFMEVGPMIADIISSLIPAISPLVDLIAGLILTVAPIIPVFAELIGQIVGALAPAFSTLLESLAPFIQMAMDSLMPIIPILAKVFGDLAGAIMPIAASILQSLMPVLPPLYDVLGQLVQMLGEQLVSVINMLAPYFPMIIDAFVGIVIALLPLLPPLLQVAMQLLPALLQIFAAVIPIILQVVVVLTTLVNYIVPILVPVITFLSSIISTVFNAIANVITWAVNTIIMPILNTFNTILGNVGGVVNWLWKEVIEPAWNAIGAVIQWVWENVVQRAFDGLKSGIQTVGDLFTSIVNGIEVAWNKLGNVARTPINWVIRNVINGGIGRGWKAVDDFLGGVLPDWKDVGELAVPGMAKGGPVPMQDGAKAGVDSVLRNLMPGEFVMSVPAVHALGMDNLTAFNDAARGGRKPGNEGLLPVGQRAIHNSLNRSGQFGMDTGGEVKKGDPAWDSVKSGMDYAQRHQPRPYMWGGSTGPDGGTDCSGWMSEIADVVLGGRGLIRKWATGSFPGGGGTQGDNVNAGGQTWAKGLKAGMSIGVSVPHTAGTIGGLPGLTATNIESGGNTGQGNTFGGPATGANDPQFPTQYHLPIVDGEFMAATGGISTEQKRRGVTRAAEKLMNGIIDPIYGTIKAGVGEPPPTFRQVPEQIYNGQVKPFKKKVLDEVSRVTSLDGWEDMISGAAKSTWDNTGGKLISALNPFDTGGILPPGVNLLSNQTGQNEYILTPQQMEGLSALAAALEGSKPLIVNIASIGGEAITKEEFTAGGGGGSSVSEPSSGSLGTESPSYIDPDTSGADTPSMGPQTQKEKTIAAVVAEGKRRGLSDEDIQSAVATVLVESEGEIYANESVPDSMGIDHTKVGSDHDSVGPFQQRNSWGSAADRMDPTTSAGLYFDALEGVSGRDSMSVGERAQAVQRSAFPGKYDERAAEANELIGSVSKSNPLPVEVMPTTADTEGHENIQEGEANGQQLQGAAIDKDTGEYLPENNPEPDIADPGPTPETSKSKTGTTPTDADNKGEDNGLKVAKSFASTFGFDKQAGLLEEKGKVLGDLSTAVGEAMPAYAAALAGNPAMLTAQIGKSTGEWAAKTATDFASFGVENAGGILESAMSMFGAPLLAGGTVNIGANEQQVQSALEDQNNRRARRTKEGRRRR